MEHVVFVEKEELDVGADDWIRHTVDELKSSAPNALATGPFGSAISSRHFIDEGIPVIRGSNLSQDVGTRLSDDGLVFVSDPKQGEGIFSIIGKTRGPNLYLLGNHGPSWSNRMIGVNFKTMSCPINR